ncbi:hemerythrin domain-containing protein [Gilvimarinus algae]|uniref:Hemerythrin domain-containing protein n=1 Tax=Gilvimarinus algae TaxID=3058037 RepID=A0ABT8TMK1_9GAMM|nr:hemerythrin domain-containing protein [Gilvimarinus sp. SDUM040014]MDO3383622.1 hemerythrin domain-containing protein [Gilvimarinus sp. SDUM040014]
MTFNTNPLFMGNAIAAIHKTLRAELFAVSALLSHPAAGIDEIISKLAEIRQLLNTHSHQEDSALESLLRDYDPAMANRMEDDHLKFGAQLQQLCAQASTAQALPEHRHCELIERLYLDWNRFVGEYLLHLDLEERVLLPALMRQLSPVESLACTLLMQAPPTRREWLGTGGAHAGRVAPSNGSLSLEMSR